jgi:hypothetical protein
MYVLASFYKRSQNLFSGSLSKALVVSYSISPAGFIKVTSSSGIQIYGVYENKSITETITKISLSKFSRITKISPAGSSFLGSILAVDSNGIAIPTNTLLFTRPVDVGTPFLKANSPVRIQDDLGNTASDKSISISIRGNGVKLLSINDLVKINGVMMPIRDIRPISSSHWTIQAVYKV